MQNQYCARCLTTFQGTGDEAACPNLSCGGKRPEAGWGIVLGPGDLLDRHYKITRALAVGGAGITYLAQEIDGAGQPRPPDLAIKLLYTQRASGPFLRRLSNEAQILQDLAHDHIVQCRGFVHRTGHEPYLVTLFEQGGALSEHIERVGPVGPRVAAAIVRQILLALDVAHQRGVIHRDLKPDNVLMRAQVGVDEVPHIRLTDFGIAKVSGGTSKLTRMGAFVGTPEYAAPEQFEGLQPTPATDIFAAGGVLWYCLTGQPPVDFSHRGDIETSFEELLTQIPPRLENAGLSGDPRDLALLQEVLDRAMALKADERWTIHQLIARLTEIEGRNARLHTLDPGSSGRGVQNTDPTLDAAKLRAATLSRPGSAGAYQDSPPSSPSLGPVPSPAFPPVGGPVSPPPLPMTAAPPPIPVGAPALPVSPPPLPPPAVAHPPLPSTFASPPDAAPTAPFTAPNNVPPPAARTGQVAAPPRPEFAPAVQPPPPPAFESTASLVKPTATPAPARPRTDANAVSRGGCLGLSLASMLIALVGGAMLVGALLLGAAWFLGYFGGPPPVVVVDPISF